MTLSVKCLIKSLISNKKNIFLSVIILASISFSFGAAYIKKEIDTSKDEKSYEQTKFNPIYQPQILIPDQTPLLREIQSLREEVVNLKDTLSEQKQTTNNVLDKTNEVLQNQQQFTVSINSSISILQDLLTTAMSINQQITYRDAFILNKTGKPFAYIDNGLRLYDYYNGNLLGFIHPVTNEIVRNYDNSIVALIENDFVLDEGGRAIGTVERSETLRWDREKLYSQVQKKPGSQFIVRPGPRQFIISPFRSGDWSQQNLEDILGFQEKKIQKLK